MKKTTIIFFIKKIHSISTILALILSFVFLMMIFFKKKLNLKGRKVFLFPLLVSFLAVSGSLFYSEHAFYEVCKLCWFQRILMYPQLILFIIAYFLNDKKVFYYSLVLSLFGIIISSYHYLLQFGLLKKEVCDVVGYSVSCAKKFIAEFGFVTIPLMAASCFLLLILYGLLIIKRNKN